MKFARTFMAMTYFATTVRGFAFSPTKSSASVLSTARTSMVTPFSSRVAPPRSLGIRMMSGSPMEFAKAEIEGNKVVVFSKSFCPFCKKTKTLLTDKGVEFKLYELNEMDDGAEIQDALLEISGQKTVPNVFINGVHVGGNSETQDAEKSGKLDEMLSK